MMTKVDHEAARGGGMKEQDVDEQKALNGDYCRKRLPGCFCDVGYPYERQCPTCRDERPKDDDRDYCWAGGFCAPAKLKSELG